MSRTFSPDALLERLPSVRGRLEPMRELAPLTWLRVGGPAEVLFSPADIEDLAAFLSATPEDIPVLALGVGSNVIVRDGGIRGVVVRLGRGFNAITVAADQRVIAGAAALDARVALSAASAGVDGMAFLRGIPGTIGGALRMNAGAYGRYMADILVEAHALRRDGSSVVLSNAEMGFGYRHSAPRDLFYTGAVLQGSSGEPEAVLAQMEALMERRAQAQPVKDRTAGSTFRNPAGFSSTGKADDDMALKAWKLIDEAGCRGLARGGAVMNEKHPNFLTNAGGASAAELEALGEEVIARVRVHSGHELTWEIERIGEALAQRSEDT
ncbi:MAG: UDP-N-acetylmuramate dehydrogenase [Neomegalonema sp.]|nr:UDP-N-acetylmuramate dehydrogenase [Neomegalonema sp.]